MPDLVIRGGKVLTPDGLVKACVAIEDERISAVAPELGGATDEIDASGLVVLPGLIDVHVHFNEPGRTDWEGAATGSRALAAGGGTTFFDMPLNSSPCTLRPEDFDQKRKALEAASITDFGLWGGIVPGNAGALAELAERGVVGFKAFLCNSGLAEFPRADDLTLYEGMREAARLRLPVAVHAESEEITSALSKRLQAEGRRDIAAFLESRPVLAEVEAIQRAGLLAREAGCRLHIVHISSGRGVAAALEARALGTDVSIETCPHYLFFTEDDLARIGAIAKCAPPLRGDDDHDRLWSAVLRDSVDIVGSDHSPCPPDLKQGDDIFAVWGGIAGVQCTLAVLIEAGYYGRGLSLDRISAMLSANPAKRFAITEKGSVQPGKHADLSLVDMAAVQEIRSESLFQRHRVSPYVDYRMRGVVRRTIRRGKTIFADGVFAAQHGGSLVRPDRGKGTNAASGTNAQQLST